MKEHQKLIKERNEEHDGQLAKIYDAIENLLDERAAGQYWEDRGKDRI